MLFLEVMKILLFSKKLEKNSMNCMIRNNFYDEICKIKFLTF
jgi:hypothetical protein